MRARILRRLPSMFDKTDNRSAAARALYKQYADRRVRHKPTFRPGDFVFLSRPPKDSKTIHERESDMAHSKLRPKVMGPFEVLDDTAETVTIRQDGLAVTVSIDRRIKDP